MINFVRARVYLISSLLGFIVFLAIYQFLPRLNIFLAVSAGFGVGFLTAVFAGLIDSWISHNE